MTSSRGSLPELLWNVAGTHPERRDCPTLPAKRAQPTAGVRLQYIGKHPALPAARRTSFPIPFDLQDTRRPVPADTPWSPPVSSPSLKSKILQGRGAAGAVISPPRILAAQGELPPRTTRAPSPVDPMRTLDSPLLARRLCLTRRRYTAGPTTRAGRVCVVGGKKSPDGDCSPRRGDRATPSARGAWDLFFHYHHLRTTASIAVVWTFPSSHLLSPDHHDPGHLEAPRASKNDLRCPSALLPRPTPVDSTPRSRTRRSARAPGPVDSTPHARVSEGTSPPRKRRGGIAALPPLLLAAIAPSRARLCSTPTTAANRTRTTTRAQVPADFARVACPRRVDVPRLSPRPRCDTPLRARSAQLAANAPFACATEWGAPFSRPRNTSLQRCALGIISAAGLRAELARLRARLLGGSPEGDGIWRSREWGASARAAPAGRDRKSCLSRVGRCFQRAPLLARRDLVAARRSVSHARECSPLAVRGRLFHPARQRLLALGRRLRISFPTHDSPDSWIPRPRMAARAPGTADSAPHARVLGGQVSSEEAPRWIASCALRDTKSAAAVCIHERPALPVRAPGRSSRTVIPKRLAPLARYAGAPRCLARRHRTCVSSCARRSLSATTPGYAPAAATPSARTRDPDPYACDAARARLARPMESAQLAARVEPVPTCCSRVDVPSLTRARLQPTLHADIYLQGEMGLTAQPQGQEILHSTDAQTTAGLTRATHQRRIDVPRPTRPLTTSTRRAREGSVLPVRARGWLEGDGGCRGTGSTARAGRDCNAGFFGLGAPLLARPHRSAVATSPPRGEAFSTHRSGIHSPCADYSSTARAFVLVSPAPAVSSATARPALDAPLRALACAQGDYAEFISA
ncbi:hypothetical protein B0H14DRAFT_3898364 [Mycena olivaceomarginata]|nr:hypothetical protein B0H14DRAFT_3898364 [Mycena olivaceomarginata]